MEQNSKFPMTQWSLVSRVRAGNREALDELCEHYWYPLYAFVRYSGYGPHYAEDLTQSFFLKLIDKNILKSVNREKGKLRTFLLSALKSFMADDYRKGKAEKRGGNNVIVSINAEIGEEKYAYEPKDNMTPDRVFEFEWLMLLIDNATTRLRAEFRRKKKEALFDSIKELLLEKSNDEPYDDIARKNGLTLNALKMTVSRMRKRFQEIFQNEIAQTVMDEGDVMDEIRDLMCNFHERH